MTYSTHTFCPVVLLTVDYCISGELELLDQRLSDFLNVREQTKISLHDGKLARLNTPGTSLRSDELIIIPKSRIAVAFESDKPTAPQARRFYSYVSKFACPVFVTAAGMQVSGNIQTQTNFDLRTLNLAVEDKFQPITEATVVFGEGDRYRIDPGTVMVNLRHVQYLAQRSEDSTKKQEAPRES